jgi:hypothetical protein
VRIGLVGFGTGRQKTALERGDKAQTFATCAEPSARAALSWRGNPRLLSPGEETLGTGCSLLEREPSAALSWRGNPRHGLLSPGEETLGTGCSLLERKPSARAALSWRGNPRHGLLSPGEETLGTGCTLLARTPSARAALSWRGNPRHGLLSPGEETLGTGCSLLERKPARGSSSSTRTPSRNEFATLASLHGCFPVRSLSRRLRGGGVCSSSSTSRSRAAPCSTCARSRMGECTWPACVPSPSPTWCDAHECELSGGRESHDSRLGAHMKTSWCW